jgi:hypothetical protein
MLLSVNISTTGLCRESFPRHGKRGYRWRIVALDRRSNSLGGTLATRSVLHWRSDSRRPSAARDRVNFGTAASRSRFGTLIGGPWRWPPPCYRVCEFATGVGGWASVIGGLSIAYATIPMNKRTGMTIGGTRYFMVFPLLENRIGGCGLHHFFSNAAGRIGRGA